MAVRHYVFQKRKKKPAVLPADKVKKALTETVRLNDGRYGYIISEFKECGNKKWNCHVCDLVFCIERKLLTHLSDPIHLNRLRIPHHPPEDFETIISKDDALEQKDVNINFEGKEREEESRNNNKTKGIKKEESWSNTVRPDEPIPPGMEDMIEGRCKIQSTLDNYTAGPLIGIEYLVELVSSKEGVGPRYICLLCEKKGDPRNVMDHLASLNHAVKYISCFFRTAGNIINLIPNNPINRKGVAIAISKVAEQIEKHHGRLKPTSAAAETFAQNKFKILRQIDEKDHFRETPSTTFEEYVSAEKIQEYTDIAEDLEMINSTKFLKNIKKPELYEESKLHFNKNDVPKTFLPKNLRGNKANNVPSQDKFSEKLSLSTVKPERSLGRNKAPDQPIQRNGINLDDDDDVIFVPLNNDPIEVQSMSSISSASNDDFKPIRWRSRSPIRHRSRSRSRGRMGSPLRRRERTNGRKTSPHRRDEHRSRSRSRERYYRDSIYSRVVRDCDLLRPYPKDKRSLSREKDRDRLSYESRMRMERDRYRRPHSPERDRKRETPPRRKTRRSRSLPRQDKSKSKGKKIYDDFRSKLEIYRSKLHDLEVEMDNKLEYFREHPEKHPQYSEEWKNFWNKRYKEILQSGKDPNSYDFKPEWIIFWEERMKQLHEVELNGKKEELKSLIPKEEKEPRRDLQDISPPIPDSRKDITVDDIDDTWKAFTGSNIKALHKQRSPSEDRKSPPRSPFLQENRMTHGKTGKVKHVSDVASPIVHCLRMLSVLEHQLGSLGPKVLELLSKALSMEKFKTNESMTLLHDEEMHIFFETVKEKIRGQLIAGIVARFLVNSCHSVINTIESMLAAHPAKPKQPVPPTPAVVPSTIIQPEPVKVAGVGMINKMAVSQQIAETLVAQGRTDVSQQELEELINAVVGIASSSNANLNQSSTAFISQLNIQKSTANSHINELLGNLIASAQKTLVHPSVVPVQNVTPEVVNAITIPQVPSSLGQLPYTTAPILDISSATRLPDAVANTNVDSLIKNISLLSNKKDIVQEKVNEKDGGNSVFDEDLKDRLIKFKSLNRDEQQKLIALLKDLESKEPQRVEKLRQYVAIGLTQQPSASESKADGIKGDQTKDGRFSQFSSRAGGTNPVAEEKVLSKPYAAVSDQDDDEDYYSVEDVYKSVSEKLKKKEDKRKPARRLNLSLDILDENSKSSPLQPPKSDRMHSVPEPPNVSSSESFVPPIERGYPGQIDNPHVIGGPRGAPGNSENNQWCGNGRWPHDGNQNTYSAPSGASGFPNSYKEGTYTGPQDQYKPVPGAYYNTEQEQQGYMGEAAVGMPYPPYNTIQPNQPGMYSNQGEPYSYHRPPAQGPPYYNNCRQY